MSKIYILAFRKMGCISPFVNHSSFLFVFCYFLLFICTFGAHTVFCARVTFALAGGGFSQMVADRCPQLLPLVRVQSLPPDKNINKAVLDFNRQHPRQSYTQMRTQEADQVFVLTRSVTQMQNCWNLKLRNSGNTCDYIAELKYN